MRLADARMQKAGSAAPAKDEHFTGFGDFDAAKTLFITTIFNSANR